MRTHALRTRSIRSLLRTCRWTEEVLASYGVDVETLDPSMSLDTVCWLHRLDAREVAEDLEATEAELDVMDDMPTWQLLDPDPGFEWSRAS